MKMFKRRTSVIQNIAFGLLFLSITLSVINLYVQLEFWQENFGFGNLSRWTATERECVPKINMEPENPFLKACKRIRHNSKLKVATEEEAYPVFQRVAKAPGKFYIHSAYFDTRNSTGQVRVIGATWRLYPKEVYCTFFDHTFEKYEMVNGRVKPIGDNWELHYSSCIILCEPPLVIEAPTFVTVTVSPSLEKMPSNLLPVRYSPHPSSALYNFAACISPSFNFEDPIRLIEWLEYYNLMGIEHFTFHNHSIAPQSSCVLASYGDAIAIHPWPVPFRDNQEIVYFGQLMAINTCMYDYRGRARLVLNADLDEFIVPQIGENFTDLIRNIAMEIKSLKGVGEYSFMNAFYLDTYPEEKNLVKAAEGAHPYVLSKELRLLRRTYRMQQFNHDFPRTKYLAVPEAVEEAGVHWLFGLNADSWKLSVPTRFAHNHHYRKDICSVNGSEYVVHDNSAHRFARTISHRVFRKLTAISKSCAIPID